MTIPSILCSLLIFYYFVRIREIRRRLNNHIILILLLFNFIQTTTEMPFALILLRTGFVPIQTPTFCLFWSTYTYALFGVGLTLMCYACMERYFLVFHHDFFKQHLILLHYGPLFVFLLYPPLVYIGLIVIYPCERHFDYKKFVCGGPCFQYEFRVGLYDWSLNVFMPVVIAIVATTVLLIRIILQKCHMRQQAIWQRNRKMVVQLTSISIIYIIAWIPTILSFLIALIDHNSPSLEFGIHLFCYFPYIVCVLCPFMCLIGLSEVQQVIKGFFTRRNFVRQIPPNTRQLLPILMQNQTDRHPVT